MVYSHDAVHEFSHLNPTGFFKVRKEEFRDVSPLHAEDAKRAKAEGWAALHDRPWRTATQHGRHG